MSNDQNADKRPLFSLGHLVATSDALNALFIHNISPLELLQRHVYGDWGDVCEHDAHQNQFAIRAQLRILSSYPIADDTKVWVITEADRSATTILLPDEY